MSAGWSLVFAAVAGAVTVISIRALDALACRPAYLLVTTWEELEIDETLPQSVTDLLLCEALWELPARDH
ncbi:hypothetical protein [Kitasatospora sp. NPDC093102]|uniref:hypothetical protein n=1 Tax=Kitasatospora sp. NPDC093102 TaxID=3155069 RepID=UPI0034400908